MKIFITDEQKAELEHLHDTTRDGRARDRIKAVLLASEGWTSAMIAQALRLHETTVNQTSTITSTNANSSLKTAALQVGLMPNKPHT